MTTPEIDGAAFYDCVEREERLTYSDPDSAIEAYLDDLDGQIPESLTVYGFAPVSVEDEGRRRLADWALRSLLESLDDDAFGDPEEASKPTEAMRVVARAFVDAVLEEYKVWHCEKVGEFTIDAHAWVREHRPWWLREGSEDGPPEDNLTDAEAEAQILGEEW